MLPLFFALPAVAHPLSVSYSHFTIDQQNIHAIYRLPMDDMDLLLELDSDLDGRVRSEELHAARDRLKAYVWDRVTVTTEGVVLRPELKRLSIWMDSEEMPYIAAHTRYRSPQAVVTFEASVRVLTDLYPGHRNLAAFTSGKLTEQYVFQHGNRWVVRVGSTNSWQTAREFTRLGIEHILTGYDHLLFLLGLLLVARGLRDLFVIVTSFTAAHSLTLALATLGIFQPTVWVVESAIALSIAYVGVENLIGRNFRRRWLIAFAFGLLHGFGFAAMLQEMRPADEGLLLALFTFNVGVEVGQVAIVAPIWPLLQKLRRTQYRLVTVRVISTIILGCGLFWFVQRVS